MPELAFTSKHAERAVRASLQDACCLCCQPAASHNRQWFSATKPADVYCICAVTPPQSGYVMLDPELPPPRFSAMNAQKRERRPALPLNEALSYVKARALLSGPLQVLQQRLRLAVHPVPQA